MQQKMHSMSGDNCVHYWDYRVPSSNAAQNMHYPEVPSVWENFKTYRSLLVAARLLIFQNFLTKEKK